MSKQYARPVDKKVVSVRSLGFLDDHLTNPTYN